MDIASMPTDDPDEGSAENLFEERGVPVIVCGTGVVAILIGVAVIITSVVWYKYKKRKVNKSRTELNGDYDQTVHNKEEKVAVSIEGLSNGSSYQLQTHEPPSDQPRDDDYSHTDTHNEQAGRIRQANFNGSCASLDTYSVLCHDPENASKPAPVPLSTNGHYESDPMFNGHYESADQLEMEEYSLAQNDVDYSRLDENDTDHDYQEPFWEPATKEEELLSQIVDLNVARISESSIEILECLGSGQFGMVHKARWVQRDKGDTETSTEVAVKTMTQGATEDDKIKFLQEAAIMGQFHHSNILEILGVVMDGERLKIVVDLMRNGDLHQHLASLKKCHEYDLNEKKQLLMSFTRQVAFGLSYLFVKSYVHRDLAARNVLVSEDGICKIADFGLSRDLRNENYYKSRGGKIPVKWTAPEALNFHKYSTASDVWSYGCLLYEIWSLGEKPFSRHTNIEAMRAVSIGYRLPPPPGCPRPIYKMMIDCWHPISDSRPTANQIVTGLQKPDFVYLKWPAKEVAVYSEEARTLGTPLENGHSLHMDLQRKYFTDKEPSSADLKEKNGENKFSAVKKEDDCDGYA